MDISVIGLHPSRLSCHLLSREIGTLVFGEFELPSGLSRSDSLYIYILYFVLRDFVTKHPKIPESHIVAVFHVPRGHGQDPPFLRFLPFFLKSN